MGKKDSQTTVEIINYKSVICKNAVVTGSRPRTGLGLLHGMNAIPCLKCEEKLRLTSDQRMIFAQKYTFHSFI